MYVDSIFNRPVTLDKTNEVITSEFEQLQFRKFFVEEHLEFGEAPKSQHPGMYLRGISKKSAGEKETFNGNSWFSD